MNHNQIIEVPATAPQVRRSNENDIFLVGGFIGILLALIVAMAGTLFDN